MFNSEHFFFTFVRLYLYNRPVVVQWGSEMTEKEAATERALLALANDIVVLNEAHERVVTQLRALALRYRVEIRLDEVA